MEPLKNLLIYMPQTYPSFSTRVFKAFVEMTSPEIQAELLEKHSLKLKFHISGTFPLDRNRNEAVDLAISAPINADYIMFVDGDNILPKNAISKLFESLSDEYPVVSGLYWRKTYPYACVQGNYADWTGHENQKNTIESMGFVDKDGNQCLYYQPLKDFDTQRQIDVAGMGCVMAKAEVFKKIDLPYFGYFNSYSLGGDFTIDHSSEEMLFFCKLHKAGIKTLLVPDVKCGHEVTRVIGCPES